MSYPYRAMTEAEIATFLATSRHAILATNRADGSSHLSPVWYLPEHHSLYFGLMVGGTKMKHIANDPRVAICVDGGHPDARSVALYGAAEPLKGPTPSPIQFRIARRYLSSDDATTAYLERALGAGGLQLVRVRPLRVVARDYN